MGFMVGFYFYIYTQRFYVTVSPKTCGHHRNEASGLVLEAAHDAPRRHGEGDHDPPPPPTLGPALDPTSSHTLTPEGVLPSLPLPGHPVTCSSVTRFPIPPPVTWSQVQLQSARLPFPPRAMQGPADLHNSSSTSRKLLTLAVQPPKSRPRSGRTLGS